MAKERKYTSLKEFYPYYLTEHAEPVCRNLHFVGTGLVISIVLTALITQTWWLFAFVPLAGYGFAWAGHFFFEKNRPATFTYPGWSLASDFIMFWHILTGKLPERLEAAKKTIGVQS